MILGALVGFVVSLGFGLSQEGTWPATLGRAAVAALVAGYLMRWWSNLWLQSLQEANRLRWQQAQLEAEQKAATHEPSDSAAHNPTAATHKP